MPWAHPKSQILDSVNPGGAILTNKLIPVVLGHRQVKGRISDVYWKNPNWYVGVVWCMGEIDAIESVLLDGAAIPGGVFVEHHKGDETSTVSALLSEGESSYSDTKTFTRAGFTHTVAYTAFRFPATAFPTFPSTFHATVRGLQVNAGAYSANPAHICRFLIEDQKYGLAGSVRASTFESWATRCAEILAGKPRHEMGLLLSVAAPVESWIQTVAAYGNAWVVREGTEWVAVPHRPITYFEPVDESYWRRNGFSGELSPITQSPTRVEVEYLDNSTDLWTPRVAAFETPPEDAVSGASAQSAVARRGRQSDGPSGDTATPALGDIIVACRLSGMDYTAVRLYRLVGGTDWQLITDTPPAGYPDDWRNRITGLAVDAAGDIYVDIGSVVTSTFGIRKLTVNGLTWGPILPETPGVTIHAIGIDYVTGNLLGATRGGSTVQSFGYSSPGINIYEYVNSTWTLRATASGIAVNHVYQFATSFISLGVWRDRDGTYYVSGYITLHNGSAVHRTVRGTGTSFSAVYGVSAQAYDPRNNRLAQLTVPSWAYGGNSLSLIDLPDLTETYPPVLPNVFRYWAVGFTWSSDTTPPTATFMPAHNSVTALTSGTINIGFDEPIRSDRNDSAFTEAQLISLVDLRQTSSSGAALGHSLALSSDAQTITVTPSPSLEDGVVWCGITNGYYDSAGNQGSAASVTFTVNTGVAYPVFTPGHGDATSERDASIIAVFSKPIYRDTSQSTFSAAQLANIISLRRDSASGNTIAFSATIASDNRTVTIDPSGSLPVGSIYVAVSDSYYDSAGDPGEARSALFTVFTFGSQRVRIARVNMHGITNYQEAYRAAKERKLKLDRRRVVRLRGMDDFLLRQVGDGISLPGTGTFSGRYIVTEEVSRSSDSGDYTLVLTEYGDGAGPFSDDAPDTPDFDEVETSLGPGRA